MLRTCVRKFDVTGIIEKNLGSERGLRKCTVCNQGRWSRMSCYAAGAGARGALCMLDSETGIRLRQTKKKAHF